MTSQFRRRTFEELTSGSKPAWPLVDHWVRGAKNQVEVLSVAPAQATAALVEIQVTTQSPMGAIIAQTGGILVDHGWLRILGGGQERLPRSLPDWNKGRTWLDLSLPPPLLLVADDVIGGFFAVNGGALTSARGHIHYFAPDSLAWEDLEMGYSEFVQWAVSGDVESFYEASR